MKKQSGSTDIIYTYDVNNGLTAYQQGEMRESYTYDIELDSIVIQVKSGGGNGIVNQTIVSGENTGKIAVGYAPHVKLSIIKDADNKGIKIFTDIGDLIKFISEN